MDLEVVPLGARPAERVWTSMTRILRLVAAVAVVAGLAGCGGRANPMQVAPPEVAAAAVLNAKDLVDQVVGGFLALAATSGLGTEAGEPDITLEES